jgi:hypothetical protein
MKFKSLFLACLIAGSYLGYSTAFADQIFTPTSSSTELDLQNGRKTGISRQDYTDSFVGSVENSVSGTFGNTFNYFRASNTGER